MNTLERQLEQLKQENEILKDQLRELGDTISAIQNGEVDAMIVNGPQGEQIFSLKGADHSYRVLIEEMQEGAVIQSDDGRILFANTFMEKTLDVPLERIIGNTFDSFVHPDDVKTFENTVNKAQSSHTSAELKLKTSADAVIPVYLTVSRVLLDDVHVYCLVITDLTNQKRWENILREEKLSRSIIEQSADAIIVCDGTGKVIRASRTANDLLADNCLGELFDHCCNIALAPGADGSNANTAASDFFSIDTVLNGDRYESCDVTFDNNGTSRKHMLLSAAPLLGDTGKVVGCVINLSDISEKIKLEQDLRKSREWFATTLRSIGDGVMTTDAEGLIVMMNHVAEELTGWTQEEALNQPLDKVFCIINEITRKPCESPVKKVIETKEIIGLANHTVLVSKDGREIPIFDSGAPILTNDGETLGIVLVFQDDTERRASQKIIEESEKKYRSIIEYSTDHIFMINLDGVFLSSNNRTQLFALPGKNEDVAGKSLANMYAPKVKNLYEQRIKEVVETLSPVCFEYEFKNRNGDLLYYQDTLYPIFQNNKLWAIGGICHDATEIKHIQKEEEHLRQKLQQAQKMESIGQLAGGIAHDFNNILYPIMGFTQLSRDDLPKDHPVQENLTDILDGAKRARDLVKRILLFSRQKKQKLEFEDLKPVIKECHKLLRASIPTNIDLTLDLCEEDYNVLCNESEIHEILLNLCTNSYHAIVDDHGKITIGLQKKSPPVDLDLPPGEYICLIVSDNGVGIPEKIRDKIFEPYMTTKDIGKGSGLGLAVVYGIVKDYKGGIHVESAPNTGTEFNIFLPIASKVEPRKKNQTNKPLSPKGKEHVLFVDDEEAIIKLFVQVLERNGYTVTAKKESQDAFECFKSNPDSFDLVVTDMSMPGMIGSELAQKILEIKPDIPIIICSGYSSRLDEISSGKLKISAYLDKPLTVGKLLKVVRNVLDNQAELQTN